MQGSEFGRKSLFVNYIIFIHAGGFYRETQQEFLTVKFSLEVYCLLNFDLNVCLCSLQFLSTLFAPLNFVMEKVESILPSSLWHQLTRI